MVDDSEMTFEDIVEGPIFSPDGQHVAIVPIEGEVFYLLLDGKRGRNYSAESAKLRPRTGRVSLVFSPNSQHVAYWAQDRINPQILLRSDTGLPRNRRSVVLDGNEGKVWVPNGGWEGGYNVWDPVPGQIVFDSDDRFHYVAAKAGRDGIDLYLVEERVP